MGKLVLTPDQRMEILVLHRAKKSIRWLATHYDVARSTIHYIVDPKAAEKNRKKMKLRQRKLRKLSKGTSK